jgi:hypothetical protein
MDLGIGFKIKKNKNKKIKNKILTQMNQWLN